MKLRRARPHICGQTNKAQYSHLLFTGNTILKTESLKTISMTKSTSAKSLLPTDKQAQAYRQLALSKSSTSFVKVKVNQNKYYDCIDQSLGRTNLQEEIQKKSCNRTSFQQQNRQKVQKDSKAKQIKAIIDPSTLRKIKDIYKDKTNVNRVLRSWKLIEKGHISSQELQLTLKSNFNVEVSDQQCRAIVQKFTNFRNENNKLDAQGLVTLFFAQNINSLLIHKSPLIEVSSQQRNKKVHQFLQGSNGKLSYDNSMVQRRKLNQYTTRQLQGLLAQYNTCASKLREVRPNSDNFQWEQVQKSMKDNKKFKEKQIKALKTVIQQLGFDEAVHSIYNMKDLTQRLFEESLKRSNISLSKYTKSVNCSDLNQTKTDGLIKNTLRSISSMSSLKNINKQEYPFNFSYSPSVFGEIASSFKNNRNTSLSPKQFYGQNQQKTRFGANPLHQIKEATGMDKVYNEKQKIEMVLKQQRNVQKSRYQSKIDRIRKYHINESVRLNQIQNKENNRQQNKLKNIKHTLQAYNYVNFLKNHWQ